MIKIHLHANANAPEAGEGRSVKMSPRLPAPVEHYDAVPDVFFLELTNNCNMHCTFCPSDYLKKGRQMADDALAVRFIEQVRDLGMNRPIQFNVLGEPLLNKKIYKYIDLCERAGIEVYLITNFAILDAQRARAIFRHHNVALVLSLQTPTADSYQRLRGYNKLTFDQYFDRIFPALREKFALGSASRIEIHVTSTYNLHVDATIQSDFALNMWDTFSLDDKEAFVRGLLDRFDAFSTQLQAEFPGAFEAEHARSMDQYANQIEIGHIAARRDTVPADAADLAESRFWGYMFAPNCFIRFKTFGLWTKERSFMQTFLPKDALVYIEERTEPLDCSMAHNVSMLADGQLSLCCLDYEGEMGLPSLHDVSLSELLRDPKRLSIARDAMSVDVCRRCQGNAFVFDTRQEEDADVPLTKFGKGWHPYEPTLSGTGGRWSNGNAFAYFFARTDADILALRFLSVFDTSAQFSALVREYDEATVDFGEALALSFNGAQNQVAEVELPVRFESGKLYRIDFLSPTFVPAHAQAGADQRTLGLALIDARVRQKRVQVSADSEERMRPASVSGRLKKWIAKYRN